MSDSIMSRFYVLSMQSNIPDMHEYAKEWLLLAMECDKQGRPSTAQVCRTKAKHYEEMAGGEYVRLVDGCMAELFPVELATA